MRKIVARGISFRVVAILFFGLGAAWTYWALERTRETGSGIPVFPIPIPRTLQEKRLESYNGGVYAGFITTCGAIFYKDDNPNLTEASRLRLRACQMESEEARKLVEAKWREKRPMFMEVQYPCPDCRIVFDVRIEKNKEQNWQITIWRRPDEDDEAIAAESVGVGLKRRYATERDFEKHELGESVLSFLDADGNEIISL